jgi:O-antigen/teichoic acid export membrane protein
MSTLREHLAAPLYRNAYLLILGATVSAGLGFVFWALAARQYPVEVVGLASAVVSAMMLVSGACQLGLNAVLVRYIPAAGSTTRRFVVRCYVLTGSLSVVVAGAAALTSHVWSSKLGFLADDWRWFVLFVVATCAWTIFALQDSVMTGMRQTHWVAIENPTFAVAKIVMLLAFVSAVPRGGIFLAWTVPTVVSLVPINLLIFARLIPQHVGRTMTTTLKYPQMIRFAAGNYAGTLFSLAGTVLLPIIVTNVSGARAAAHFYIPWTLATGLQLIALYMTTSLTVEVAFDESKLHAYGTRVLAHTLRLVTPLALVLVAIAPYVLRVFGPSYAGDGVPLLRLLVLATIPNIVVVLGISVARLKHNGSAVLLIQAAQSALIVGLSITFLNNRGIEGVGIAVLVSQIAVAVGLMIGMLRPVLFSRSTSLESARLEPAALESRLDSR